MEAQTVDTTEALKTLQSCDCSCYLQNANKQLYVLDVLKVDPLEKVLDLAAPTGRTAPLDPSQVWMLTFKCSNGAHRTRVEKLERQEDKLVVSLSGGTAFLKRRHQYRFREDSRNPARLVFHFNRSEREGRLVDMCRHGIGVILDKSIGLKVGETVRNGSFTMRAIQVGFDSGEVVHREQTGHGIRLGLKFVHLDPGQRDAIANLMDTLTKTNSQYSLGMSDKT